METDLMPQFQPDFCTFGDKTGYSYFDMGHYREHLQFVQVLQQQTPDIELPPFDFLSFLTASDRKSAIDSHNEVHQLLSGVTGITAPDFSGYDLKDESSFYQFTQDHSVIHSLIRQFLGIV